MQRNAEIGLIATPSKRKDMNLNIHYLQHVPFEGLGSMEPWFRKGGHRISSTPLYLNQDLPAPEDLDWLVVMGGPMGVHDESRHSWLKNEKRFIESAMKAGSIVLGVCLGAQLIADVLGARVFGNRHREIGWFPIQFSKHIEKSAFQGVFPSEIEAFHWHGDTFDIPESATLLASSEACAHQGFIVEDRILGFQFHLETTPESADALIDNCKNELDGSRYVQSETEILSDPGRFNKINQVMIRVLERLETLCASSAR